MDNQWWHDLHVLLKTDRQLVQELALVRGKVPEASHLSLLRVFDVMCWMFSWEGETGPCSRELPD